MIAQNFFKGEISPHQKNGSYEFTRKKKNTWDSLGTLDLCRMQSIDFPRSLKEAGLPEFQ